MLYVRNRSYFYSSESIVKLNTLSSTAYSSSAMSFLTHVKIILENQSVAPRIAEALKRLYKLEAVVLIHKRSRKCAFTSSLYKYNAKLLAKD